MTRTKNLQIKRRSRRYSIHSVSIIRTNFGIHVFIEAKMMSNEIEADCFRKSSSSISFSSLTGEINEENLRHEYSKNIISKRNLNLGTKYEDKIVIKTRLSQRPQNQTSMQGTKYNDTIVHPFYERPAVIKDNLVHGARELNYKSVNMNIDDERYNKKSNRIVEILSTPIDSSSSSSSDCYSNILDIQLDSISQPASQQDYCFIDSVSESPSDTASDESVFLDDDHEYNEIKNFHMPLTINASYHGYEKKVEEEEEYSLDGNSESSNNNSCTDSNQSFYYIDGYFLLLHLLFNYNLKSKYMARIEIF